MPHIPGHQRRARKAVARQSGTAGTACRLAIDEMEARLKDWHTLHSLPIFIDLALELGFTDQSHLHRHFKS